MSMELYCCYATFPEPIELVEDPQPPFPDISVNTIGDMLNLFDRITVELKSETRLALEHSYLKMLSCNGDVAIPDDPSSSCFSPDLERAILAQVPNVPVKELRTAIERHADSEFFEDFTSVDEFFLILDDIRLCFQQAADSNLGLVFTVY